MSDEREHVTVVAHNGGNHPLAKGFIAGAAVGMGLGMLFAPRRGSELREQVKVQVNNLAATASTGYHHAMDATGHWAHRGHDLYVVCRDKLVHGAHETRRYVRDVSDAVTKKTPVREIASPQAMRPAHAAIPTSDVMKDVKDEAKREKKDLKAI